MDGPPLSRWRRALLAGDDRGALDLGLRLLEAGACPLPARLCLPGCWLRVRGLEDLDDFLDSLAWSPGVSGAERALLAVATARLHPAALSTTDALSPRLLLLASALGALARNQRQEAARLLPLCGPRRRLPGHVADILEATAALASGERPWPSLPSPPGPPSPALATRIARALEARAASLARRGDPLAALGLIENALAIVPPEQAEGTRLAGAELWLLAGQPEEARRLLSPVNPASHRARALAARLALEEDRPAEAEALASQLQQETGDPEAALLRGVAVAAQERWQEAEALLRAALERKPSAELEAASLHWLGVAALARCAPDQAESLLREALARRSEALGPGHPEAAETTVALGTALAAQGHPEEAARCFRQALVALEEALGEDHPRATVAASSLAELDAWREATALEQELAGSSPEDPELLRKLRGFRGFLVLRSRAHGGVLTTSSEGMSPGVVVFLTPHRAEAFLAHAEGALREELEGEELDGEALGRLLREQGVEGAVLQGEGEARWLPASVWAGRSG